MNGLAKKLATGVASMGLDVSPDAQERLLQYLALLHKWNKIYNLTAVREPMEMVTLHLLDSLSVLSYVKGERMLDVGSGGGLPGIVLAICLPTLEVTTVDTVQKKTIFMRQVKGELGLDNLNIVHARVEKYQPEQVFDLVISRAFSEIALLIKLTRHLLIEGGYWFAMKGLAPNKELEALEGMAVSKVYPLSVAGLAAERHLVIIENKSNL